jgi:hypothetical protein
VATKDEACGAGYDHITPSGKRAVELSVLEEHRLGYVEEWLVAAR